MNNDREWFQPRKADYERLLKEPLEALCVDLGSGSAIAGPPGPTPVPVPDLPRRPLEGQPPYKTHVSASFPWAEADTGATSRSRTEAVHRPGGYLHVQPDEGYVGGGMWHPDRPFVDAWRALVSDDPNRVHAVRSGRAAFRAAFGEAGAIGSSACRRDIRRTIPRPSLKLKDVVSGGA